MFKNAAHMLVLGLLAVGLLIIGTSGHAATWTIKPINAYGGLTVAVDINNVGQVAGYVRDPRYSDYPGGYPPDPFAIAIVGSSDPNVYEASSFPKLGGFSTYATAINDLGQIVGLSAVGTVFDSAFMIDANSRELLFSSASAVPADINNVGQTIFNATDSSTLGSYISASLGGGHTQIITPGMSTTAVALNDRGQVAVNDVLYGYLWTAAGGAINLTPTATSSRVIDINNLGQILGMVNFGLGEQAFLSGPNGAGLTLIDTLGSNNHPTGINGAGQIVGTRDFAGQSHGYVSGMSGADSFLNLDMLPQVTAAGWTHLMPIAINDSGQIAGVGYDARDWPTAFLLTPVDVPTPNTYALLLGGLGLMTLMRRSKAHKKQLMAVP